MFLRIVALALVAVGACYFAIPFAVFGGTNPYRLSLTGVPRIRISIEAIASGMPVSGEWTVPAIKHFGIPSYWLTGGIGSFRTVRSPFDTVFKRLPTGEGIGIDLGEASFDMGWNWQPVVSPIERSRSLYFLLDSIDRPRILIDYAIAAQGGFGCPQGDLILGCKISSRMSLLRSGPLEAPTEVGGSGLFAQRYGSERYDELRRFGLEPPKPMIFAYVRGTVFQSSALRDKLEIEPTLPAIVRPTIVWIDWPTRNRLLKAAKGKQIDLAYDGSNSWSLDSVENRHQHEEIDQRTAHVTDVLTPDDLECCQWPSTSVKRERIASILATIKYRGEVVSYGPVPASTDETPMLIDPESGTLVTFYGPQVKVIWMLSSK